MFNSINKEFNKKKRDEKERQMIVESVLDVEEVLPGSDEDMDDIVDPDSIPDDIYKKIDAELEKIVNDPNYDDTEAEELLDDDDDEFDTGFDDADIDAIMDEAVNAWYDDEKIHHPNVALKDGAKSQPVFRAPGQSSL